MKAYTPGGKFDADFETDDILAGVTSDLTNPIGTSVLWYVWVAANDPEQPTGQTEIDPVYDVGLFTEDGSGGRRWRDPVDVPVIKARITQGTAQLNQRGLYAPDRLRLTLDRDELMRHIPDVLDNPDPLDRDRIVWKGQVYRPFLSQEQGLIKERFTQISFDCMQVMPEEMVNDTQFQDFAQPETVEIAISTAPVVVQPTNSPMPVTRLSTQTSANSATLHWNLPLNAATVTTLYFITGIIDPDKFASLSDPDNLSDPNWLLNNTWGKTTYLYAAAEDFTFTGLAANTQYTAFIYPFTVMGPGPVREVTFTTLSAPAEVPSIGSVNSLIATAGTYSVDLSWSPAVITNATLVGYSATLNDGQSKLITATSASFSNLLPSNGYVASVSTQTNAGNSAPVSIQFTTAAVVLTSVGPVTSLSATSITPSSASITWGLPTGVGSVDNYTVELYSLPNTYNDFPLGTPIEVVLSNGATPIPLPAGTPVTSPYTFYNLSATTNYLANVIATVGGVKGTTASVIFTTTAEPTPPEEPPGKITNLIISDITASTAVITWGAPENTTSVDSYVITIERENQLIQDTNAVSPYVVTSGALVSNSDYTVTVWAVKKDVYGLPTEAKFTTKQFGPVTNLRVDAISTSSATIKWGYPVGVGTVSGWTLNLLDSDNSLVITTTPASTSYTATGLSADSTYTAIVAAYMPDGMYSEDASITFTTLTTPAPVTTVGPVTGISVTSVTSTSASLSWSAPSGYPVVNSYQYELFDTNNTILASSSSITSPYTISSLAPSSSYTANVRAVVGTNVGANTYVLFNTNNIGPVTNLTLSSVLTSSVTIAWGAPSGVSTGLIDSYSIVLYNATNNTLLSTFANITSPYTIENLNPDTSYKIEIYAVSNDVDGVRTPYAFRTARVPSSGMFTIMATDFTTSGSTYGFTISWAPFFNATNYDVVIEEVPPTQEISAPITKEPTTITTTAPMPVSRLSAEYTGTSAVLTWGTPANADYVTVLYYVTGVIDPDKYPTASSSDLTNPTWLLANTLDAPVYLYTNATKSKEFSPLNPNTQYTAYVYPFTVLGTGPVKSITFTTGTTEE